MRGLAVILVIGVLFVILAVPCTAADFLGVNGTITIEHIGENEIPLGQSVTVLGSSSVSPDLVIRILGPNLPAEGASPLNSRSNAGEGVHVSVGDNSRWTYIWNTSNYRSSVTFTAVYTIRASDAAFPEKSADFSIKIVKPDMAVTVTPATVPPKEYVAISGRTAGGTDTVRIEIIPVNQSSPVLNKKIYQVGVERDNTFELGVHADLPAGEYEIALVNPVDGSSVSTMLTVSAAPQATVAPTVAANGTSVPTTQATMVPADTTVAPSPAISVATPMMETAGTTLPAQQPGSFPLPPWLIPLSGGIVLFIVGFATGVVWAKGQHPPRQE